MTGGFNLRVLQRISALIDEDAEPVTMFVTSQHFAVLAAEMVAFLGDAPVLPNPSNFKELMVGKNLLVVNSGSENQGAVNLANQLAAERTNFAYRRDNFRTG